MRSTKIWILIFGIVLAAAIMASIFVMRGYLAGTTANIYQNGELIGSIDLSLVSDAYTITVTGAAENVVSVERGRICVNSATCPDQICVNQGWISNGIVPIVCLPNSLVIEIKNAAESGLDAVVR